MLEGCEMGWLLLLPAGAAPQVLPRTMRGEAIVEAAKAAMTAVEKYMSMVD